MAAIGVATAGVVAGYPSEYLAVAGVLVGPGVPTAQGLAFDRGVERLRERVVGAGPDRSHRLSHPERWAVFGEGPGRSELRDHCGRSPPPGCLGCREPRTAR